MRDEKREPRDHQWHFFTWHSLKQNILIFYPKPLYHHLEFILLTPHISTQPWLLLHHQFQILKEIPKNQNIERSVFLLPQETLSSARMQGRYPPGGFASSCGGDGSTSTLNQHQNIDVIRPSVTPENTPLGGGSPRTLEDMILQLEIEEDVGILTGL